MIDVPGGNKVYYYHFDGLGSVIALSDVNSEIVERYSYDIFGEPNRTSDVNNPYLFTGRRYDGEAGLYYYRARHYDPNIGRFLQTDPIGYDDGMNIYAYVGNNSINYIDPYGLEVYMFKRGLQALGDSSARHWVDPFGHEMLAIVNDGKIEAVYSWGVEYENGKGVWSENASVDRDAIEQAIKKGWGKRLGDSSHDDYLRLAFEQRKDKDKHPWLLQDNCQAESQDLWKLTQKLYDNRKNGKCSK
ncbi:MAG: RHS repeat-associated core domain-containing protein [Planctomycetes bacterium]|nr:RHS repeat-associated core domain-containing protein [Planctomycetota bacterium]